jgi:hypothetical protein
MGNLPPTVEADSRTGSAEQTLEVRDEEAPAPP